MFRLTGGHWGKHFKKKNTDNIIMTCTVCTVTACCVNYTAVSLCTGVAWLCVNKRQRIAELQRIRVKKASVTDCC